MSMTLDVYFLKLFLAAVGEKKISLRRGILFNYSLKVCPQSVASILLSSWAFDFCLFLFCCSSYSLRNALA